MDKQNEDIVFKIEYCIMKKSMLSSSNNDEHEKKINEKFEENEENSGSLGGLFSFGMNKKNEKKKKYDKRRRLSNDESDNTSDDSDDSDDSQSDSDESDDEKKQANDYNKKKKKSILCDVDIDDKYWSQHGITRLIVNPSKLKKDNTKFGVVIDNLKCDTYYAFRICGTFAAKNRSSIIDEKNDESESDNDDDDDNNSNDDSDDSDNNTSHSGMSVNMDNQINNVGEWSRFNDKYLICHTLGVSLEWHKGNPSTPQIYKFSKSKQRVEIDRSQQSTSGYQRLFINYIVNCKDWKKSKFIIQFTVEALHTGIFIGYIDLTKFPNIYNKYKKYYKRKNNRGSGSVAYKKIKSENKFSQSIINQLLCHQNLQDGQYLGSRRDYGYTFAFASNQKIGYAYSQGRYKGLNGQQSTTIPLPIQTSSGQIWRVEFDFRKRTVTYYQNNKKVGVIYKGNVELPDVIIPGISTSSGSYNASSTSLKVKIAFGNVKSNKEKMKKKKKKRKKKYQVAQNVNLGSNVNSNPAMMYSESDSDYSPAGPGGGLFGGDYSDSSESAA